MKEVWAGEGRLSARGILETIFVEDEGANLISFKEEKFRKEEN